jgi:hypothetical protein
MKAIEVAGTIEEGRRVRLDEPLPPDVSVRVRLIILILIGEDEPSEPRTSKIIAAVSLTMWISVLVPGRLLTFYRPGPCEPAAPGFLAACIPGSYEVIGTRPARRRSPAISRAKAGARGAGLGTETKMDRRRNMKVGRVAARLAILAACAGAAACAHPIVRPSLSPSKPRTEALLVLPGFGYGRAGEKALRTLVASMAAEGFDLYVPTYVSRSGLSESRARLERFIRDHRLDLYDRLHVFAFIAGAWTFNPLVETQGLRNLATVVYDRSPFQERAPRIAAEHLHFLTWVRYGSPVFDVARTPYSPLPAPDVKVALMVETTPTSFIKRHEKAARGYGPFRFECDAFTQRYDDCLYLSMNHDELYVRFADVWPELLAFIRTGRFTTAANRTLPTGDPLAGARQR